MNKLTLKTKLKFSEMRGSLSGPGPRLPMPDSIYKRILGTTTSVNLWDYFGYAMLEDCTKTSRALLDASSNTNQSRICYSTVPYALVDNWHVREYLYHVEAWFGKSVSIKSLVEPMRHTWLEFFEYPPSYRWEREKLIISYKLKPSFLVHPTILTSQLVVVFWEE